LHIANVPILCAVGRDEQQKKIKIGPNALVDVPENGDLKYVEHQGSAIGAGKEHRRELLGDIARMSISIIAPKAEIESTATEQIIDKSEQDSDLSGWARNLQDALELASVYHARLKGESSTNSMKEGGSITVNREFVSFKLDAQMITALSAMVASGQLPLDILWDNLERAGLLPEGFDREKAREQIADDAITFIGADVRTGADPNADPATEKIPKAA
jgi:hypothetical protein